MYSFSFSIQLVQAKIEDLQPPLIECAGIGDLKVEVKQLDQLFFYGSGFRSEDDATDAVAVAYIKVKVALLRLGLAHRDWMSIGDLESKTTKVIIGKFKRSGIAAHSFFPATYETGQIDHWPLPHVGPRKATLAEICKTIQDSPSIHSSSSRVLESMMILSAALTAPNARTKIVLSVTAIEVLITRRDREPTFVAAVDQLLASIATMEFADQSRKTLIGVLEDAKRESIGVSGKKLVHSLLGKKQAGRFYDLYDLRSKIVHGNPDRPALDMSNRADMERHADEAFTLALELALRWDTLEKAEETKD